MTVLTGGVANTVRLISRPGQADVVLKTTDAVLPGLYEAEAEGLTVLTADGGLRTPKVLDVGPTWLPQQNPWDDDGHAFFIEHRLLRYVTEPKADALMIYCTNQTPPRFFDAYVEVRPLEAGWRDRMPILHVRELLCILAQHGDSWDALDQLRTTLRPFRTT